MEQIRVFVSSAMQKELSDALDWPTIRSNIIRNINAHQLFDVFAIENHASPEPSNQYMLSKVAECHVYLLILGKELRKGTRQEYEKALELHKDMLVFVYDVEHDESCESLIEGIQKNDYCCYRNIKVTDDIGSLATSDLINHVARRFKGYSKHPALETGAQQDADIVRLSIAAIKSFGTSALLLGEQLGYPYGGPTDLKDDAALCELGGKLANWLLVGTRVCLSEYREIMIAEIKGAGLDNDDLEIVDLRWRACDLYFAGNTNMAIQVLEKAAAQGKDKTHLLTGVLIDLRNLVSKRDGLLAGHACQEEITKRGMSSYVPVGDCFTHEASDSLQDAEDSEWLKPERTVVLGEYRLSSALLSMSSALFANAIYGSITGIECSRLSVAKLLMNFSRLYIDKRLYAEGLRLCVLGGDSGELEKWLNAGFDYACQEIVAGVGELWDAACVDEGTISECGCVIFTRLGMYFDDGRFFKASRALLAGVGSVGRSGIDARRYAAAITSNAARMSPGSLVQIMVMLISGRRMHSASWINETICEMRLEDASKSDREELARVLEERYAWLCKHGFSPSCIAVLAKEHEEFVQLGNTTKARLSSFDLLEYEVNEDDGPLSPAYAINLVEEARSQLIANDNSGMQSGFATQPAKYLARIVDSRALLTLHESMEAKLSMLWEQVAHSGAPGSFLDDYMQLAISMVVVYREAGLPLPDSYRTLARMLKNKQPKIDSVLSTYERRTWTLRVATYRLLVGVGQKRAFLDAIFDVWNAGITTREACAECLDAYLRVMRGVTFRDMPTFVGVVNVLSRDKDAWVRQMAVNCTIRLLDTSAYTDARSILHRLAGDPRPSVRAQILRNGAESLKHPEVIRELARYLENDAHFGVRAIAQRMTAKD